MRGDNTPVGQEAVSTAIARARIYARTRTSWPPAKERETLTAELLASYDKPRGIYSIVTDIPLP